MLASTGNISDAPATFSIERWKPVPGYEGLYEVSDHGRVLSHRGRAPKILRPYSNNSGHLKVAFCDGRRIKQPYVHKLVMEAFVGSPPPGMEVRHLDGNPANNALSNLAYGTRGQNMQDRKWHRKARNPTGKLFGPEASQIKVRLSRGERGTDLAREFGVHKNIVSRIKRGLIHCDA